MVVGFTPSVDKLYLQIADLQIHRLLIGHIRGWRTGRQEAFFFASDVVATPGHRTKLPLVNGQVVTVGGVVAVKTRLDILVAHNLWSGMAAILSIAQKGTAPPHMIHMTMGVDQTVERVFGPIANGFNNAIRALQVTGIEDH